MSDSSYKRKRGSGRLLCEGAHVLQGARGVTIAGTQLVLKPVGWITASKRLQPAILGDVMNDQATGAISDDDLPDSMAGGANGNSLLVDTAIGRCEKLRRVVELEEWINGASDNPILATTCRRWQEERERLLTELRLERGVSPSEQ